MKIKLTQSMLTAFSTNNPSISLHGAVSTYEVDNTHYKFETQQELREFLALNRDKIFVNSDNKMFGDDAPADYLLVGQLLPCIKLNFMIDFDAMQFLRDNPECMLEDEDGDVYSYNQYSNMVMFNKDQCGNALEYTLRDKQKLKLINNKAVYLYFSNGELFSRIVKANPEYVFQTQNGHFRGRVTGTDLTNILAKLDKIVCHPNLNTTQN